jgi:hypothetical protein
MVLLLRASARSTTRLANRGTARAYGAGRAPSRVQYRDDGGACQQTFVGAPGPPRSGAWKRSSAGFDDLSPAPCCERHPSADCGVKISVSEDPRIPKFTEEEAAFGRRAGRRLGIGLQALAISLVMSGIVLANGNNLSKLIDVEPNSILFQLWPFNRVYLQQFASSHYDGSEIKWFFTVVSCSNLVWLVFLCWKIFFEVFRRDVQFPRTKSPAITNFIVAFLIVSCVIVAAWIPLAWLGFSAHSSGLIGLGLNQSIAAGAIKVVMVVMASLYAGVAFILEFGGLGVRYWLFRMLRPESVVP